MASSWEIARAMRAEERSGKPRDLNPKPPLKLRVNDEIDGPHVRLIMDDGTHQVLKPSEARELARQRGMDLVEVDGAQRPPVCKLQLAGKALFLAAQKEKEYAKRLREAQRRQTIKEVRFTSTTAANDMKFKVEAALVFLKKGHKVRLTISHPPYKRADAEETGRRLGEMLSGRAVVQDPAVTSAKGPKNSIVLELALSADADTDAARE